MMIKKKKEKEREKERKEETRERERERERESERGREGGREKAKRGEGRGKSRAPLSDSRFTFMTFATFALCFIGFSFESLADFCQHSGRGIDFLSTPFFSFFFLSA